MLGRPGFGRRLKAIALFAKTLALVTIKRIIRYELIPYDIRTGGGVVGRLRFALAAIWSTLRLNSLPMSSEANGSLYERLQLDGVAVTTIPRARFNELSKTSAHYFIRLHERRLAHGTADRAFDESRSSVARGDGTSLFETIELILEESGLMSAANRYKGRTCKLVDVNPQINDRTDGFWRNIFSDMRLNKLPDTAYCHRDASGGDLKAIIYMTDVGPENGPFSFVIGSHRLKMSPTDNLICEVNDTCVLSGTGANARKLFSALPVALQQKGTYGNDLDDESIAAQALTAGLWAIEAPRGSIVLFDTKGTHRGGMVVDGERRVITCVIG